jgi:hypothetical protein
MLCLAESIGITMAYQSEELLLQILSDKTARIQAMADLEAKRAIAGVTGRDLWPAKKELIEQCEEMLNKEL